MSLISVRQAISPLIYNVKLPMVDVVLPENADQNNPVFQEIVAKTFELLDEKRNTLTAALEDPTNMCYDWLSSVPYSLRHSPENIVNYLGMLVSIDFRHWAELPTNGKLSSVGEVVEGFTNFYTRTDTYDAKSNDKSTTAAAAAANNNNANDANRTNDKANSCNLVRGSAAMVRLLYEAVERHGVHWYSPEYLQRFKSIEEAEAGLSVCFWGCMEDGTTPLLMPSTRERITLTLSLRDVFLRRQTSYYQLLCQSNGRLYTEDNTGFIQQLILLHDRYKDYATCEHVQYKNTKQANVKTNDQESTIVVPIMKLAQLTALSIMEALPLYWRNYAHLHPAQIDKCGKENTNTCPELSSLALWYENTELKKHHDSSDDGVDNEKQKSIEEMPPLFSDEDELAMCCDYQIPKVLHDAGILKYNDELRSCLSKAVLLQPGGAEEVNIRIATLIGSEVLLKYLHQTIQSRYNNPTIANMFKMRELDFVLWWVGRHPSNRACSRHHLCKSIMY